MGKRLNVTVDHDQFEAFEEMLDVGDADSYAEAVRMTCSIGLKELGYLKGTRDTRLRVMARRFGDAFAIVGVMWLGVSFWLPLEFRVLAVAPFAAWGSCRALDRLLARYEPRVSARLGLLQPQKRAVPDGGDGQ